MLNRTVGNSSSSSAMVGYGVRTGDAGPPDLLGGQRGERPQPVGHPVEHGVVEGQQHAVTTRVHVGLEVVVASFTGVPERVERVLQAHQLGMHRSAAMGHRDHRARLVQHGVEVCEPGARGPRRRHA
jgi:hypothetical protein